MFTVETIIGVLAAILIIILLIALNILNQSVAKTRTVMKQKEHDYEKLIMELKVEISRLKEQINGHS